MSSAPTEFGPSRSAPLESWRGRHVEHHLHTGATMLAALADRFDVDPVVGVPYAYRWFASYLRDHPRGHDVTRELLTTERNLLRAQAIVPIGMRAIARCNRRLVSTPAVHLT